MLDTSQSIQAVLIKAWARNTVVRPCIRLFQKVPELPATAFALPCPISIRRRESSLNILELLSKLRKKITLVGLEVETGKVWIFDNSTDPGQQPST